MLNTVGPQMVGATDLKSMSSAKTFEKDFKGSGAESSFGKTLQDKLNNNPVSPKDPKELKDSPRQEAKAKDREDNDDSEQKPTTEDNGKTEQKVAKPDGNVKKKSANRQQAIKEFMDSFESEFEIPPTRLVEAMAKLDDSQLKESPEKTADAVVKNLGLDDAQADKARAMYASMLLQLQQTQQPQRPMPEMALGGGLASQQGVQARVAAAQEQKTMMGSSIEHLNKKFWMNEQAAPTAMPTLDGNLAQKITMDDSALAADGTDAAALDVMGKGAQVPEMPQAQQAKVPQLPPHLQGQMQDTMSPALLAALAAKKAAAQQRAAGEAGEDSPEMNGEMATGVEAPQAGKALQGPQAQNVVQGKATAQEFLQQHQQDPQGQSFMQNQKEFAQKATGHEKDFVKGKLTAKAAEFKTAMTGMEGQGLQGMPMKADALKFDPMAPAPVAAPVAGQHNAENEAAVKQLMNQAQYLIKNGGGEMKVQMTPEGMGTVHLKVMLENGKVNLQMSADTQEAKKTIESSLAELKTSLAAHKLSVENVKVDVVNSASADTATQNQTNMNGHGQRDQRQFWNQFNDNFGNQGRREALADFQNIKGYGGKRADPLQPIETANAKSSVRTVNGKGSGLNLVA